MRGGFTVDESSPLALDGFVVMLCVGGERVMLVSRYPALLLGKRGERGILQEKKQDNKNDWESFFHIILGPVDVLSSCKLPNDGQEGEF